MAKPKGPVSQRSVARKWKVSLVTVQSWERRGLPIFDEKALAESLITGQTSQAVRERAVNLLNGYTEEVQEEAIEGIQQAQLAARKTALNVVEDMSKHIAYLKEQVDGAIRVGNHAKVQSNMKLYAKASTDLTRVQLNLQKLGQDTGNAISRTECLRMFKALGSRSAKGISGLKEEIAKRVAGCATVEDAALKIEPVLVWELFFEPFKAAAGVAADCGLDVWVVDGLRGTIGDFVEDGEAAFDEGS